MKPWQDCLTTAALGRVLNLILPEVDSTNTRLKQLKEAPHGALCMAGTQTAGRGRLNRTWVSPQGCGLWLSVLVRPALSPAQTPLLTFCAALAMRAAIQEACGVEVAIKWPNDLVLCRRKVCGILLEGTPDGGVVIGTGVNLKRGAYPEEIKNTAIALAEVASPVEPLALLPHYLNHLEKTIAQVEEKGYEGLKDDYARASCTLGQRVQVTGAVTLTGQAEEMDEEGALLVRTEDGQRHRILSGDVSVRGVMGYV